MMRDSLGNWTAPTSTLRKRGFTVVEADPGKLYRTMIYKVGQEEPATFRYHATLERASNFGMAYLRPQQYWVEITDECEFKMMPTNDEGVDHLGVLYQGQRVIDGNGFKLFEGRIYKWKLSYKGES